MKPWRSVLGLGIWMALAMAGCGKPTPPSPPVVPEPEVSDPEPEAVTPEPEVVEPEPVLPVVSPPAIPAEAVAGTLDGEPFAVAAVSLDGTVLTLTDEAGRTVAVVVFDRVGDGTGVSIDLTGGEVPFGSPHVVVRAGEGSPTRSYTGGYRLLLELGDGAGGIWLQLPDERGEVAGTFEWE